MISPFSRLSQDWRDTLLGLAVGAVVFLLFLALGLEVVGAFLAPFVAVGVSILRGEASQRKAVIAAKEASDARNKEAQDLQASREALEQRIKDVRRIRAEQQRIALGYAPDPGLGVADEGYLQDWQRFNKRLSDIVHTLSPYKADSTPWDQVHGELEEVLAKLKAGTALLKQLEENGIETTAKGQQHRRLAEVVARLGKQKTALAERSLNSRFRDWNAQLFQAMQIGKPWLELETETEVKAWLDFRTRPEKQPFGVSHEGAEHFVADWLRYLGQLSVEVTQFVGDGGVDVETEELVVQVKNYGEGGVSSSELRDLLGAATAAGRGAALFTSSRLTKDAKAFAELNDVACIAYDAKLSRLSSLTQAGQRLLEQGQYSEEN